MKIIKLIPIRIDERGQAHSVSVPPDATGISFQAAAECTVFFDNSKTFGTQSIPLPADVSREVIIVQPGSARFSVSGGEDSFAVSTATYDIIFES